jgi:hypothetical protein|tara:strand:+ start:880 stop:1725 length:846 start_codon:yes stop_codon:yes gene_type:complete
MKKLINILKKDHFLIGEIFINEIINFFLHFIFNLKNIFGYYNFLKKNIELKNIYKNKRIIIIANAPSINNFDLKKVQNETLIMVNRSFMHSDYEFIKPAFHIIVDPKLASGVWPLKYIDIIFKKNPNVKLILNADWYHLKKFYELKNNKNVYWVKSKLTSLYFKRFNNNLCSIFSTLGVTGNAVSLASYLGSKKIYILGMELNGVIKMLNNENSHFNGKDIDYDQHNILDWSRDLGHNARGLRYWYIFSETLKKNNICLINLSKTGLFNFVPSEDYNQLFK